MENYLKEIDEIMQLGYSYAMDADSVSACNEWKKVWDTVVSVMDSKGYKSIEEFDKNFTGTQCVFNWSSDYDMELANATREDISFGQTRIDFCKEFIKRSCNEFNKLSLKPPKSLIYLKKGTAKQAIYDG